MTAPDAGLRQAVDKLHRSTNGTEPALRAEADRQQMRSLKRTVYGVAIMNSVANLVLVVIAGICAWFALHAHREYFASDNGRVIALVPMSQPYRRPADVIAFAKATVEASFTLDFNNYRGDLEQVRPRYTRDGFKNYISGLQSAGILQLLDKRMNLTSGTGVGVLVEEGEEEGTYAWKVRFPLTLKLVGQTTEMPEQRLLVTVLVRRIPTLDSLDGIGVAQVVTQPL